MSEELESRSTPDEAQRRADRIRGHIASAWEEVITAFKRRDFEALGYGSGQAGWDAYILGEYGESRLMLPRAERVQRVIKASQAGMSTRAIAAAAGVDQKTVSNDLRSISGEEYSSPAANASVVSVPGPVDAVTL